MSKSNVHLYKLQERQYDVEADLYKRFGELQDLRKKIAEHKKGKAKDHREKEQHLIKKAEFEERGIPDKALKSEVKAMNQDTQIAKKDAKIKELERRVRNVEEEIATIESELSEAEADVKAHETGAPVDEDEPYSTEENYEDSYEPAVLDDSEDEDQSESVDDLSYQD